jgi:hypothetical protein
MPAPAVATADACGALETIRASGTLAAHSAPCHRRDSWTAALRSSDVPDPNAHASGTWTEDWRTQPEGPVGSRCLPGVGVPSSLSRRLTGSSWSTSLMGLLVRRRSQYCSSAKTALVTASSDSSSNAAEWASNRRAREPLRTKELHGHLRVAGMRSAIARFATQQLSAAPLARSPSGGVSATGAGA